MCVTCHMSRNPEPSRASVGEVGGGTCVRLFRRHIPVPDHIHTRILIQRRLRGPSDATVIRRGLTIPDVYYLKAHSTEWRRPAGYFNIQTGRRRFAFAYSAAAADPPRWRRPARAMPLAIAIPDAREAGTPSRPVGTTGQLRESLPELLTVASSVLSPVTVPPTAPTDRARVEMTRHRRLDWITRRHSDQVSRELDKLARQAALEQRNNDVQDFEGRRARAYAEAAERRQHERLQSRQQAKQRVASTEERRQQSIDQLRQTRQARNAAVEISAEARRQEGLRAAAEKTARAEAQRDEWRARLQRAEAERAESLRQRAARQSDVLRERGAARSSEREDFRQAKLAQQLVARQLVEDARSASLAERIRALEERTQANEQRREADARKRQQAAKESAEAARINLERRHTLEAARVRAAEELTLEIGFKERRVQAQLAHLHQRRREAIEASSRRQLEGDLKHRRRQQQLEALAAENERRLQQKAREAEAREAERRAAQAALMEMRREADAELSYEREAHRGRHIATRADSELRALSRSLSESQIVHRRRARSAARLVRSVSAEIDEVEL